MQGVFHKSELEIAAHENLDVVFHHMEHLNWLDQINLLKPIKAWLKINTGLNRLGFSLLEGEIAYHKLKRHPKISQNINILSHFACADIKEHLLNN